MVSNEEIVEIIGQEVIPIRIVKHVKHVSFRLVPKLKSMSILGTSVIESLRMTLNYDTETWWLTCSPSICYHMGAIKTESQKKANCYKDFASLLSIRTQNTFQILKIPTL